MTDLSTIIGQKDGDGLIKWMQSLVEKRDRYKLVTSYRYLKALAVEQVWLVDVLSKQEIQDLWFMIYTLENIDEVVCSFEYDFFSRCKTKNFDIISNNAVVYGLIDLLLGINYANDLGPRKGVYGKEFFLTAPPTKTMKEKLCSVEGMNLLIDSYTLRPDCDNIMKWSLLNIKMRRIAFLLVSSIIDRYGFVDSNQRAIGQYVNILSTRKYVEEEGVGKFFSHDGILDFVEGWDSLLEDATHQPLLFSKSIESGSDVDPNEPFLSYGFSILSFIYEPTPQLQESFYKRISHI